MKRFFRRAWLHTLRIIFLIGYILGFRGMLDELEDIEIALDEKLIEQLREARKDTNTRFLYKEE